MDSKKINKILKIIVRILFVLIIAIYAWSLTPKTFQNDTFYTIKIGELIDKDTEHYYNLLPWNKGLDMKDHFSYHNLPYTYPHWLYDLLTYKIYSVGNFQGVYILTCTLAIIMGLLIYFVNVKINKNHDISFLITMGSLYCLRNFITARAQLITFILFILTIFCIEQFIKSKKVRYGVFLVIISILIANLHCAVWPFYFILFLPYIIEYFGVVAITADYAYCVKKIKLTFNKRKMNKQEYKEQKKILKKGSLEFKEKIKSKMDRTFKIELVKESAAKWLILIMVICGFTGLLTPIKDTPYTYLLKTSQGNTTQSINEHLPLTLIKNKDMITILVIVFGILIFSKTKIKLRNFFMIMGLIFLGFLSQRQISMLVLIGNFIVANMICNVLTNVKKYFYIDKKQIDGFKIIKNIVLLAIIVSFGTLSYCNYKDKISDEFVDETSYPIAATEFINNELIPAIGVENLRLYNEYNYGSYLLFSNIPVFIDSRADLYAPEFNGKKDENGEYVGNDIFSDFLGISNLSKDYENKFEEYNITHVITYEDSKLSSLLSKDRNYSLLYSDEYFKIYERENIYE